MLRSADMLHSGGRHPPAAGAKLKILIFGAGGSSIRPLGTIRALDQFTWFPYHDNIPSGIGRSPEFDGDGWCKENESHVPGVGTMTWCRPGGQVQAACSDNIPYQRNSIRKLSLHDPLSFNNIDHRISDSKRCAWPHAKGRKAWTIAPGLLHCQKR